jgi:site-specific DNA recombinase
VKEENGSFANVSAAFGPAGPIHLGNPGYYHCTGYADKCRGEPASCRQKYVREEVLERQFTPLLGRLYFDDEVLGWVREALQASHTDQRREHRVAVERLRAEHKRLGDRISAMYIDKLDGKIGGEFFDKFAGDWREEQMRLQREIDRHEAAEQSYMDEGVRILELARNAQALFERQPAREKRRLLNFVLSNCSWEDGEMLPNFRQLFGLLAETTALAARSKVAGGGNSAKNEIWLGGMDSNHRDAVNLRKDGVRSTISVRLGGNNPSGTRAYILIGRDISPISQRISTITAVK